MSNEWRSSSTSFPEATRTTRSASSAGSERRAHATASASGSMASTCAASRAISGGEPAVAAAISSTRRPRKSPSRLQRGQVRSFRVEHRTSWRALSSWACTP